MRYTLSFGVLPDHLKRDVPPSEVYRSLNAALRDYAHLETPECLKAKLLTAWHPLVAELRGGLAKLPTKHCSVYRGVGGDWAHFKPHYQPGRLVRFSAFTSTTRTAATAYLLAWSATDEPPPDVWIFKIQTVSAKSLSGLSLFEDENEVLLPPFSAFVVTTVSACRLAPAGDKLVPCIGLAELSENQDPYQM